MARAPDAAPSRIFISYRREETAYAAGWLFNRLADHFGRRQVFKDVDSIDLGDDFVEVINKAVGSTDVLLALIGDQWLTVTNEKGSPRLDDPNDFVRLEIEAALAREVRVIPILVDGAEMPGADELPHSLAPLARRQALELSPSRFDFDTGRLLKVLDKTLPQERKPEEEEEEAHVVETPEADTTETERPSAGQRWRRLLLSRPRVLIGVGVSLAALVALVAAILATSSTDGQTGAENGNENTPPPTQVPNRISFADDFSTSKNGWTGGSYERDSYLISATRGPDGSAKHASPRNASSAADLHIEVEAHRTGGTAQRVFAYGLFCRGDEEDSFYAFNIWTNQAKLEKRVPGSTTPIPLAEPDPDVRAAVHGDSVKRLEAVCTTTTVNGKPAVDLQFWVNGAKILEGTDPLSCDRPCGPPLRSGSFGLRAALGAGGKDSDSLDVTFDDFAVSED